MHIIFKYILDEIIIRYKKFIVLKQILITKN